MSEREKRQPNRRELTNAFVRDVAGSEKRKRYWDAKQGGLGSELLVLKVSQS